jgi:hypothetical protein
MIFETDFQCQIMNSYKAMILRASKVYGVFEAKFHFRDSCSLSQGESRSDSKVGGSRFLGKKTQSGRISGIKSEFVLNDARLGYG